MLIRLIVIESPNRVEPTHYSGNVAGSREPLTAVRCQRSIESSSTDKPDAECALAMSR